MSVGEAGRPTSGGRPGIAIMGEGFVNNSWPAIFTTSSAIMG
jgi:hypothetical protein